MKKNLLVMLLLLCSLSMNAQWGYWWRDSFSGKDWFMELVPDASSYYNYVHAMDDESLKTLDDLLEGKRITEDKVIVKDNDNRFFVLKDHALPEGNYYVSEIYKMTDIYQSEKRTVYIYPRITMFLKDGFQINDILEHLGNNVTLETSEEDSKRYTMLCQVKTSQEVLELILVLNDLYQSGNYGILYYNPHELGLPIHPNDLPDIYDLGPVDENGMRLIYEKNWESLEYSFIWDGEMPDWSYEATDEGLAITNPYKRESLWFPETSITEGDLSFEAGHDYIVRLTLKVPSDGTYWMFLGRWDTSLIREVPVTASDDFQIIDIDFSDFDGNTWRDGFVLLGNGQVVGTTILKNVQVFEKVESTAKSGGTAIKAVNAKMADGARYNLSGQRVDASYKGIVIQNGRKHYIK
ncbi:MAG: hypothetical protein IJ067_10555 [Prevotella sp.]|nr:hypothetical protein [Prevotella sp.]